MPRMHFPLKGPSSIFLSLLLLGAFHICPLFAASPGCDGAGNCYVRAAATGSSTGADWTNAYTNLPASLTRGVTYWVAGGTYPPHVFNDPDSGSLTITIKAPTVANHGTSTGWDNSFQAQAVWQMTANGGPIWDVARENYFIADGTYCTPRSDYPAICDSGYGFKLDTAGFQISGNAGNDCALCGIVQGGYGALGPPYMSHDQSFKYLDLYGSNRSSAMTPSSPADAGFAFSGGSYNLYFGHNYIHNNAWQFFLRGNHQNTSDSPNWHPGSGSNITIEYSHLDWDAAGTSPSAPHGTPLDDSEGIQNYTIRYNILTDMGGNGSTGGTSYGPDTASGADWNSGNGNGGPWYIYGNIWYTDNNQKCASGDGFMAVYDFSMTNGGVYIYNNTFANWGYPFCGAGVNTFLAFGLSYTTPVSGLYEQNNAFYVMDVSQFSATTFYPTGTTSSGDGATFNPAVVHGYDLWVASPNSASADNDPNTQALTASPFVNAGVYNFNLAAHTAAGATLANTGTYWNGTAAVPNTFDVDMNGEPRGGSTTWDRGALQVSSSTATLQSIAVTPTNPSIMVSGTQQFTATGTYSDSSTQNLTNSVTWNSGTTTVATISGTGLSTGVTAGTSTITATLGSVSGSTTLTVTAPTLQSIAVTPANASIAAGTSLQYTATGTYSNGTKQDITASVTWNSNNTTAATISTNGLAHGAAAGTTTISATSGSISGSTGLTVTVAVLQSIAVTPANTSVTAGATQQYTATGTYSNGSTQDITASVSWSSSNTAAASISSGGLARGVAAGTTTISATSGSISGSTGLTVTAPTLQSIAVTPANTSITAGATQQYTATGTFSNGSTSDVTASVTWSSSNAGAATISSAGLARGVAAGTTTISATSGSVSGSTGLTVTAPTLQSITVTPANASITAGSTQQYTATGTYSNGSTQNITASVTWSSSNTATASISSSGLARGLVAGTTTIAATSGSISGSTGLTVTAATLQSIAVTPANVSIAAGATQQYTATGSYSNGTTQDISASVTWNSSNTGAATIVSGGTATGVAAGTTQITATSGSISGSTGLTVTASVSSTDFTLSANPSSASLSPGGSATFTITVHPVGGSFPNPVLLSVAGLPSGLTGTFSPASVTPNSTNGTSILTIAPTTSGSIKTLPGFVAFAIALLYPLRRRRWSVPVRILLLATCAACLAGLTACTGPTFQNVPPQTFNLTIAGTSGSTAGDTMVQLTLQ